MNTRVEPARTRIEGTPPAAGGGRLVPLDGLRGLAALVVVAHHSMLTWPAVAGQFLVENRASRTWWLTFTPLHLFWLGTESVIVFFVLSGLVLTLPYLRASPSAGTWRGYYARRLLRLYPPVLVALCLAALLVHLFPRLPGPGQSWWFAAHAVQPTPGLLAHDALLLDGAGQLNTVLWSLRYEVTFSLVLPLVVLAARRWPRTLWLNLPLCLALEAVGQLSVNPFFEWMPFLAVGVALAAGWDDLRRLGRRIQDSPARGPVWILVCGAAGVLVPFRWWFGLALQSTPLGNAVGMPLAALGAALLVFLAVFCPAVRRIFSSRFLQWAGRISFSLYLVHEPIVVSVSAVAGPGARGTALALVVGGGTAVGVAVVFHRLVELPTQRWARAAGRRLDGRPHRAVPVPSAAAPAVRVDDVTEVMALRPGPRPALPRHTAARARQLPPVAGAPAPPRPRLPESPRRPPVPLEPGR